MEAVAASLGGRRKLLRLELRLVKSFAVHGYHRELWARPPERLPERRAAAIVLPLFSWSAMWRSSQAVTACLGLGTASAATVAIWARLGEGCRAK